MRRIACFLLLAALAIPFYSSERAQTVTEQKGPPVLEVDNGVGLMVFHFREGETLWLTYRADTKSSRELPGNPEQALKNLLKKFHNSKPTNTDKRNLISFLVAAGTQPKLTQEEVRNLFGLLLSQRGADWYVSVDIGDHYVLTNDWKSNQEDRDRLALYGSILKAQMQNTGIAPTIVLDKAADLALGLLEPDTQGTKLEITPGTHLSVTREFIPATPTVASKDLKYALELTGDKTTDAGVTSFKCDGGAIIIEAGTLHRRHFTCTLETDEHFTSTVLQLRAKLIPYNGKTPLTEKAEEIQVPTQEITVTAKAPELNRIEKVFKFLKDNSGWVVTVFGSCLGICIPWWIAYRKLQKKPVGPALTSLGSTLQQAGQEHKKNGESESEDQSAAAGK